MRGYGIRCTFAARSARIVAEWLSTRPEVADILYPALPGAACHAHLWTREYKGAASIFGMLMRGGNEAAAHALMSALDLFGLGYSWGGFESLITCETGQLSGKAPPALPGQLLRLHVGLEDPADLIADLKAGLAAWRAAIS